MFGWFNSALRQHLGLRYMSAGGFHVREISDPNELDGLRLDWRALLARTRHAEFFQSLDWLQAYMRHYGARDQLRLLVVSRQNETLGILPLVVAPEPTHMGTLRVLTYPLREWGPFFGPIGPYPTATLALGLSHISGRPRDWDVIDLRWVSTEHWDQGRTESAMRAAGLPARRGPWGQVAMCDLSSGWDRYWATRARHWRSNVRRCERRLAERGRLTHVRYRPRGTDAGEDDPRWDLYYTCERIAARSWQGSTTTGNTLSHPKVQAFLRDAHAAAARLGAVDVNLLLLDEAPVAFMYCYLHERRLLGLRMGFDRAAVNEGAGTVLMQKVLADSCRRGDLSLNLGADYLKCKRYWQTSICQTSRYTHFARGSVRGQLIRAKRALEDRWRKPLENEATTVD